MQKNWVQIELVEVCTGESRLLGRKIDFCNKKTPKTKYEYEYEYNINIQPKKQFKVQMIGILEEIDSFY